MVELFTDSTSDLGLERGAQRDIHILPLTVRFGEEAWLDGVEITPEQFYEKLAASDTLPSTSQINPDVFVQEFEAALERGNDVVGIFISSEMSGSCQSAMIARDMIGSDRIHIVDSRTVTFPLGLMVEEAAILRDKGWSAADIAAEITRLTGKIRLLAVMDTLKYLKLGGRISAATAMVGGVLGITPIISIINGKVESVGKSRGRKAGLRWVRQQLEGAAGPIDRDHCVSFGHSACPEAMVECMAALEDLYQGVPHAFQSDIGSVVGTHIGPGATGIAYFVK